MENENVSESIEFVVIRGVLFSKKTEVSYSTEDGMDELKIVVLTMVNNRIVDKKIKMFNAFELEGEKEWFEVPQDIVNDIFEEELQRNHKITQD